MNQSISTLRANAPEQLRRFQKRYPQSTSTDLQTFVIGYEAAISILLTQEDLLHEESIQMSNISYGTYPESNIR